MMRLKNYDRMRTKNYNDEDGAGNPVPVYEAARGGQGPGYLREVIVGMDKPGHCTARPAGETNSVPGRFSARLAPATGSE